MRRALLLLLTVLLLSLCACGHRAETPEPTTPPAETTVIDDDTTPAQQEEDGATDAPDGSAPAPTDREDGTAAPAQNDPPAQKDDDPTPPAEPTCTLSISCATILANMEDLDPDKTALVPADGWILAPTTVTFSEGESVFDVLRRVCRERAIHMEYTDTPAYGSAYLEGIGNLYELDCGPLSGWMYSVNGWFPNYGCSRYTLRDGDVVRWVYTCDLGEDVGGSNVS